MTVKPERDIEKDYQLTDFVAKLRRLADAIEKGEQVEIQVAGERTFPFVPFTTSSTNATRMPRN